MSAIAAGVERSTGRVEDQGLLFEYTIKLVLFVGFSNSCCTGWSPDWACISARSPLSMSGSVRYSRG